MHEKEEGTKKIKDVIKKIAVKSNYINIYIK